MTDTYPIIVPDAGFDGLPVTVGIWLVSVGDTISPGDRIVELTCPGCVITVTAQRDGMLSKIHRQTGQSVSVGDTLAYCEADLGV